MGKKGYGDSKEGEWVQKAETGENEGKRRSIISEKERMTI